MTVRFTMAREGGEGSSRHSTYYQAHLGDQHLVVAVENEFRGLLLHRMEEGQMLDRCETIAAAKAKAGIFDVAGMISVTTRDY